PNLLQPMPTMAASMFTSSPVGAQYNAPGALAGLDQCMCLGRLLEWQRHRNYRLNRAARDQCKAVLELLPRGAGRAEHRHVLEEQLGRIERHELAGQLTDHDPTATNPQAAADRLPTLAADTFLLGHHHLPARPPHTP